mmetsp:Transcript_40293/g.87209  ORF Transcript_40293/g.87209 Transcript_40293/m.87209 type:complete len:115 (-) Transcript_40293:246-590(-)
MTTTRRRGRERKETRAGRMTVMGMTVTVTVTRHPKAAMHPKQVGKTKMMAALWRDDTNMPLSPPHHHRLHTATMTGQRCDRGHKALVHVQLQVTGQSVHGQSPQATVQVNGKGV